MISGLLENQGQIGTEGQEFTILGENLHQPGLTVRVGGTIVTHKNPSSNGTSVVVSAPESDTVGCVPVSVCAGTRCSNDALCDSLAEGYCYQVPFRRGDGNGDGRLDLSDVVKFLNFQFVGTESLDCPDAADLDDNGDLTITDAIRSLNYQFMGTAAAPEPPGPFECGIDSTVDELTCASFPPCQEQ